VYKIGFKNAATGAGLKMDVLIIENLFYKKKVDRSYDLKVTRKHCNVLPNNLLPLISLFPNLWISQGDPW
jgi:hypothetical protein